MKFDMGSDTLGSLAQQTEGSSDELGKLVRQLVAAAEPLAGNFTGKGKEAFDTLKQNTDEVIGELNTSLQAIVGGQSGMDSTFEQGESAMTDNAASAHGGAPFDGARFGGGSSGAASSGAGSSGAGSGGGISGGPGGGSGLGPAQVPSLPGSNPANRYPIDPAAFGRQLDEVAQRGAADIERGADPLAVARARRTELPSAPDPKTWNSETGVNPLESYISDLQDKYDEDARPSVLSGRQKATLLFLEALRVILRGPS